jgi:hypothetical protein
MKYLSVIIFAVLLTWTWFVINSEPAVSLETHVGIQNRLASVITDSIHSKKPTATDIVIENVWTEPVSAGEHTQVRAHFAYHFTEPMESGNAISEITGEALLERQPDDGTGFEKWTITQLQNTGDAVTFGEPLVITTGGTTDTGPAEDVAPVAPTEQQ